MKKVERWLPVPGLPLHEVSDAGRVRSLSRTIIRSNGSPQRIRGCVYKMDNFRHPKTGYVRMRVRRAGRRVWSQTVHSMVLAAFVGPRPEGAVIRHLNGIRDDNRLENLCYGTPSENMRDKVVHGNHFYAVRDRCKHGHLFAGFNLYAPPSRGEKGRGRTCRACHLAARYVSSRRRRGKPHDPAPSIADRLYRSYNVEPPRGT
ncbi:MAG: HNH homing endonuclease [uncultured Gemmatimonadetes bacterium]|uniref:HNH homing endonuclease n=1 Tax=uncultured Gemmatimonadota bacterium TaxID=203437 RepID=A0A6J4MS01_9BACT|nr:MAG: HNH homing endonuclease [uncultured Gemmatimonadota bacterium]